MSAPPDRLILMGVAGCGKTTVGSLLAERLGARFLDGDDHHQPANVAKMSSGAPLTDEDRWPWLDRIGTAIEQAVQSEGRVVVACSALRRVYRERLSTACDAAPLFIHLAGTPELIRERMEARSAHFMPVQLLDSQFAALEPPGPEEHAIAVDIDAAMPRVLEQIVQKIAVV